MFVMVGKVYTRRKKGPAEQQAERVLQQDKD
jgi:hypothetical protein